MHFSKITIVITKTCLYNFDPLKPQFYIVKLGFIGVYIIFLIPTQNIDCEYSLEPPRRGGSNEYPQPMFLNRNMKNLKDFYLQIYIFLVVKFSVYLYRLVFVMKPCTLVITGCCRPYPPHCEGRVCGERTLCLLTYTSLFFLIDPAFTAVVRVDRKVIVPLISLAISHHHPTLPRRCTTREG